MLIKWYNVAFILAWAMFNEQYIASIAWKTNSNLLFKFMNWNIEENISIAI